MLRAPVSIRRLDILEWLKNRYGDPITTARELKTVWPRVGAETGLLYFYCHASASMLALGEEETIEASRLLLTLADAERPAGRCGCLVLMNGCSTLIRIFSDEGSKVLPPSLLVKRLIRDWASAGLAPGPVASVCAVYET